jgi:hypothetical protein
MAMQFGARKSFLNELHKCWRGWGLVTGEAYVFGRMEESVAVTREPKFEFMKKWRQKN